MRLQLDTGITGNGVSGVAEAAQTAAAGSPETISGNHGIGSSGDSIRVSGASTLLSQLSASRSQRIQQLAVVVNAGKYDVPSAKISQSIVSQAQRSAD